MAIHLTQRCPRCAPFNRRGLDRDHLYRMLYAGERLTHAWVLQCRGK